MPAQPITADGAPLLDARIGIVALGGYPPDIDAYRRGIAFLEGIGCSVKSFYRHDERHLRFGGDDAQRIGQLDAALADPDIDIVLALRGGYGMSRLLPRIDFERVAASGKLLVGHSDFTALQMALLAQTGASSFAGPMLCDDFTDAVPSGIMLASFIDCLRGPVQCVEFASPGAPDATIDGTLWGGNLAMLAHLCGTPWLPRIDGGILFVEDVNEHPYRVERMLLQLLHAGVLDRQRALVLGDFSQYRLSPYDNGYDFDAMLAYLRATLPLPVFVGLPFGHMRDKVTLPVGCQASLRVADGRAVLEARGYPTLRP
ncbi:MAG: muramoyltetrapeptide carboxypeptidase [Burkholderiaceae bacterium]